MPLSAILFDKDGTFVDFHRTWGPAAFEVMQALSAGDPQLLARLTEAIDFEVAGKTFRPSSPFIAGSNHDVAAIWGVVLQRDDVGALAQEIGRRLRDASLKGIFPIGEPAAVFAALAASGFKLGIATNDSEETARLQVGALELVAHIDFIAGYDSGFGGKPGPGMVHAFAAHLGVPEREVALVGDSTHDCHAARAAGAIAIAVLSGPASRADLEAHADHVLDSIADLPELAERLRRQA